jgi:hypothetical protein
VRVHDAYGEEVVDDHRGNRKLTNARALGW